VCILQLFNLFTCFARRPNTNSIASMTFDFPLPLGPTTDEKDCEAANVVVFRERGCRCPTKICTSCVSGEQRWLSAAREGVEKQVPIFTPALKPTKDINRALKQDS